MSTAGHLFALARPKGAWIIASLPLAGLGYGLWERGSTISLGRVAPSLGLLWLSWLVGHAGAMWLNAELDRDHGPVLLGRAVPVPRGTALAGYGALALSVAIALPLGLVPAGCAAACAVLAVLYSHPRAALKGGAVGGPLINGVGYGALSPIAGWAVADVVPTWRAGLTLAIIVSMILGAYFAAQAFQRDEDARRGYRTLVVTHGPRWTLTMARACLLAGMLTALGLTALGAYPRALLVAAPLLWLADRHLAKWRNVPDGGDGSWAGRLIVWLALASLTIIFAAYVDHFTLLFRGLPPGGCGTAIVPETLTSVCAP